MSHPNVPLDVEALLYGRQLAAEGQIVDAMAAFEMALEARPANPSAAYHLGCALIALGRLAEASEVLEAAARRGPGQLRISACLAIALEQQERSDEAAAWFRRAALGDPMGPMAYAAVTLAMNYLQDPFLRFAELLRMEPGYADVLLRAARQCQADGDLESAREALEDLLELAPGDPTAAEALDGLFIQDAMAS